MNRWLSCSIAATLAVYAAVHYIFLVQPDLLEPRIPVHWDMDFQPDNIVSRDDAYGYFMIYPFVMTGMMLLTLVLPWLSPKQFEVDRFRAVYDYIMGLIVLLFGYLFVVHLWCSMRDGPPPEKLFIGGIFLFFAFLGNVLGKVQRNFWIGVRTPWTLASDAVWIRTHRLTAWLFVACGLAGFAAIMAGAAPLYCFAGVIVAALVPVVYSLVLYKRLQKEGKA
jgi:immunity protein, SdpI family